MARPPDSTPLNLEGMGFQVHLNPGDFDDFIAAHAVPFIHYRAMRCPVGMHELHEPRRSGDDHEGCSNGFVYTKAGEVLCFMSGNGTRAQQLDPGVLTGATVAITPSRFYTNTEEPVQLAPFDRLYLPDTAISVPYWQIFTAHETGIDRLNFPAVAVNDLMDNQGNRYATGDFAVRDGKLHWGARRPGLDPTTGRGRVCSIRFTYRPYWYVSQLVHEVRVATVDDLTVRMPSSAMLQREYWFEKTDRDLLAADPNDPRQVKAPYNGGFSAR